jgi:hypothetical protein
MALVGPTEIASQDDPLALGDMRDVLVQTLAPGRYSLLKRSWTYLIALNQSNYSFYSREHRPCQDQEAQ